MEKAKPDILVRWRQPEDDLDLDAGAGSAYAIIYVRPETNRVNYESEIIAAVRRRAELVYMANLNGRLFSEDGILASHFSSQLRFARDPRAFLAEYPELAAAFESRFGLPAAEADIIGSFAAVAEGACGDEELFNDIVPEEDFLSCLGQTFKRIGRRFVVNYDLPAIGRRYTPAANVFVVLVRSRSAAPDFYTGLNRAIYEEMVARPETPLVIDEKLADIPWSERVRRTYHVSSNRLMAMFDIADLVYADVTRRLDVAETPLGRALVEGGLAPETLRACKERQLCRIGPPGRDPDGVVFLPQPGSALGKDGVAGLLRRCEGWLQ